MTDAEIYDAAYYLFEVETRAALAAAPMATSIIEGYSPRSVIDVGCGTGALLLALREFGVPVTMGLDGSDAAVYFCTRRGLDVLKFNLDGGHAVVESRYDVAISVEVAEHLPASAADRYVDLLTTLAPVVVFTAAPPGQPGSGHINCQPPAYWIERFAARGFQLRVDTTNAWRRDWAATGRVADFYHQNLMIFAEA